MCYYSGASFLNKKLFCLEIDCGITSLMLEEMLISSFFVGLIHWKSQSKVFWYM